jgi:hypothetical protein
VRRGDDRHRQPSVGKQTFLCRRRLPKCDESVHLWIRNRPERDHNRPQWDHNRSQRAHNRHKRTQTGPQRTQTEPRRIALDTQFSRRNRGIANFRWRPRESKRGKSPFVDTASYLDSRPRRAIRAAGPSLRGQPDYIQIYSMAWLCTTTLSETGVGYKGEAARKSAWQFLDKTTDPRLSMLRCFAKAMGVPVESLVGDRS